MAHFVGQPSTGLTTLSEEAAEELAHHEGELRLGGLATLSEKAAALQSNPLARLPEACRR